MRIVNQWPDPHCANRVGTWSAIPGSVTIAKNGSHWEYTIPEGSSLIPNRKSGCMMMRLSPPSSWDSIRPERADTLLVESGVCVMDTTKEEARNVIGIHAVVDAKTTVTGMCAVSLDEWPILREAGALVFAADTAPY
ncbi:hypothetical protein [Bifidobacterium pseudocatenulatum]|nr:hypothetical protein [Bifidobacterium pseudocatenulatum]